MRNRFRRNPNIVQRIECVNRERNSVPDLAYYTNPTSTVIEPNNIIPIYEVLNLGDDIETINDDSFRLNNGVYDISFSVVSSSVNDGTSSVTLYMDDAPTNISSTETSVAGNNHALSARGIYVASNNSVVLRLVNTSTSPQQFFNLNLVIRKI